VEDVWRLDVKRITTVVVLVASVLMGWGLRAGRVEAAGQEAAVEQDDAASAQFYTEKVLPIFKANCYRCHGGMNHRGGLNISTRAGMLKGGMDGTVLVPGDPAKSLLVKLIRHEGPSDDPMPMPPKSPKISDADIDTVTRWVKAGAIMPEDEAKP
jgi:mono/diheme cytochrome c family protein